MTEVLRAPCLIQRPYLQHDVVRLGLWQRHCARCCVAWGKFRKLLPVLTNIHLSPKIRARSTRPVSVWLHSVQSPSMGDPRWNIWYWGSKWNLHTVCWDAVGCEWGTTFVYVRITRVCYIPSRLPVFAVEPQYRHQDFLILSKLLLKDTYKMFKKFYVGIKFKWGL